MPTITYNGPSFTLMLVDGREINRGESMSVTQQWVDDNRLYLQKKGNKITLEGDEGVTLDAGSDGLPDAGWTKKDIQAWLSEQGVEYGGYATKTKLLSIVEETLNPPTPEPVAEVEPEAPAEESEAETQTTGDE
ncbi:MAG: hypothetical protein VW270_00530 [Candidatus Poseidoniales archaeon]